MENENKKPATQTKPSSKSGKVSDSVLHFALQGTEANNESALNILQEILDEEERD